MKLNPRDRLLRVWVRVATPHPLAFRGEEAVVASLVGGVLERVVDARDHLQAGTRYRWGFLLRTTLSEHTL